MNTFIKQANDSLVFELIAQTLYNVDITTIFYYSCREHRKEKLHLTQLFYSIISITSYFGVPTSDPCHKLLTQILAKV